MEAERESLCVVPRWLVVGEVNETFVCGICDGLMREPRYAGSCSEHIFCRVCLAAALIKEARCPTCKQPVDASEPLHGFRPFEAMVNSTVVRCPNSIDEMVGGNISQEPPPSREATSSSAPNVGSVQAPGVKEEAGDGDGGAGRRGGGAGGSEVSSSPFDGVHVTYVDLVALSKIWGVAYCSKSRGHASKEQLLRMLTPHYKTPEEVACALQEACGAKRPRSCVGKWGGFTGDYEELELEELQEEAICEGLDRMAWDRDARASRPKTEHQLRHGLNLRRDACCAFDSNAVFPTTRLDLAVSPSAKESGKATPTEGGKACRAETLSGSAGSGGVGAGGSALTLGGKIASTASVVWERSELEQMTKECVRDLARDSGLTYSKFGIDLRKSELPEHIMEAQTFAASLRAKHPSSCERGASARGDWWGFPGDYEVLAPGDLETEAKFTGIPLSFYNQGTGNVETKTPETLCKSLRKRRANFAPDLDDALAFTRPSKRPCRAFDARETCGWTGKLGARAEHLAECRFAVTKCTLAGCSAKVPRKDVGAHAAECVWRGGECERCLFAFTPGEPREHECGGQQTLRRQTIPRVTLLKGTVKVLKESLGSLHQEVQELRAALARKFPDVPTNLRAGLIPK